MSEITGGGRRHPNLVVVVPARNEEDRISACLTSLVGQASRVRVFVSDNASEDATQEGAGRFSGRLDLTVRTSEELGPSEHFVSACRWALATEPEAELFALLAGDDTWTAGFVAAALDALAQHPRSNVVFPAFVWEGDGPDRYLPPKSFEQDKAGTRQQRALLLPDRRELSNLVYGVYRRSAFEDLLAAWERGGDAFASDYAAAWSVLGRHRVVSCPLAVGRRHVRCGVDLLERVGLPRQGATKPLSLAVLYVRLNMRINRLIGLALARAAPDAAPPSVWQVQMLRAPQWLWGAVRQIRPVLARGQGL